MLFDYTGNIVDETAQRQQLNQYISIYLHTECCKTSFIETLFHCDLQNLYLTGDFFIFLFMVTGTEIIFICSNDELTWSNFSYILALFYKILGGLDNVKDLFIWRGLHNLDKKFNTQFF